LCGGDCKEYYLISLHASSTEFSETISFSIKVGQPPEVNPEEEKEGGVLEGVTGMLVGSRNRVVNATKGKYSSYIIVIVILLALIVARGEGKGKNQTKTRKIGPPQKVGLRHIRHNQLREQAAGGKQIDINKIKDKFRGSSPSRANKVAELYRLREDVEPKGR